MHITFVKKILADGEACRKCREVEERLRRAGYWPKIDAVVIADERDPHSAGLQLAQKHKVAVAPFFVVRDAAGVRIYTIFLQLVREVLEAPAAATPA
ncbi:MAG: hypothetical protein EXR86_13735 [Gammaproteobacteria bacterium]|nr:hypothetical protein [Gammaproteobacteria bacterium]